MYGPEYVKQKSVIQFKSVNRISGLTECMLGILLNLGSGPKQELAFVFYLLKEGVFPLEEGHRGTKTYRYRPV